MNFLEVLEDRIAPAAVVTFTDVDGDIVKVTTSKGTNDQLQSAVDAGMDGNQLKTLSLSGAFAGSDVKIAVATKGTAGDGLVNVWAINAANIDLKSVTVGGDLAKLVVGDTITKNGAIKTIQVQTIGVHGGATDKTWTVIGSTTSLTVASDVSGAYLSFYNPDAAGSIKVGKISIGGSLIGGGAGNTGVINVIGGAPDGDKRSVAEIGTLIIGHDLASTNYATTAAVFVGSTPGQFLGKIGKVSIGGSVIGTGSFGETGLIKAATSIGDVSIGGSLIGGGVNSGAIQSFGSLGAVKIGGNVIGGSGGNSGVISGELSIKSVTIEGWISGGAQSNSGGIYSFSGTIGDVKVGTYIVGGTGNSSGSISAEKSIGKVQVDGPLIGGSGVYSGAIFTDTGNANSIKSVTIQGDVQGGGDLGSGSIETETIGAVKIAGNLIGGNANTAKLDFSTQAASVVIGGSVIGGGFSNSGFINIGSGAAKVSLVSIGGDLQGGTADGTSSAGYLFINGTVGKLFVGGDLIGGLSSNSGAIEITKSVSSFSIGGSIIGGGNVVNMNGNYSGTLSIYGNSGAGFIGGSILGGQGNGSGDVSVGGKISKLTLGGGIVGNDGNGSGQLYLQSVTSLTIGVASTTGVSVLGGAGASSGYFETDSAKQIILAGDVRGGSDSTTGYLQIGSVANLTIGGSIRGGTSEYSGYVDVSSVTGKLLVGGNITGGTATNTGGIAAGFINRLDINGSVIGGVAASTGVYDSGFIRAYEAINSVTIGGSIVAGTPFDSTNYNLGSLRADTLGTVLVKGSLVGNAGQSVMITGKGDTAKTTGTNLAIKSLTVNGSVTFTNILGGYDTTSTTLNGDGGTGGGGAQLGTITILGDFRNSSIATGVTNNNAMPNHWADGNNTLLDANPLVASIAKITIKGATSASVQNGISAELVKSLMLGGSAVNVSLLGTHQLIAPGFYFEKVTTV